MSSLTAAHRAVEIAPSNNLAYVSLAQALFFNKESEGCRNAAERAVAINPMDGNSIAFLGEMLTYVGDRERGLALAASKAVQDLLKVRPGFAGIARKHIERWWDSEYVERLIDGWRKAGLEIPPANSTLTQP
jgi:hypothetical protein